ncbi:MAG: hypothetical protein ACTSR7_15135 [Promethearchaeota archaeon]
MRFGRSNRNLERFLCLLMHIFFIIWPDNVRKTLTRYYLNNWHENLLLNFSRVSIERASYIRIAKISQRILEDASLYRSKAALILPMITLKSMMYEKHKKYSNGVNCISIIILYFHIKCLNDNLTQSISSKTNVPSIYPKIHSFRCGKQVLPNYHTQEYSNR